MQHFTMRSLRLLESVFQRQFFPLLLGLESLRNLVPGQLHPLSLACSGCLAACTAANKHSPMPNIANTQLLSAGLRQKVMIKER